MIKNSTLVSAPLLRALLTGTDLGKIGEAGTLHEAAINTASRCAGRLAILNLIGKK
jgi:hypothetical protein